MPELFPLYRKLKFAFAVCYCFAAFSPFRYLFIFIFRRKPSWLTEFGFNVLLICGCKQFSEHFFFVVFWLGFSNLVCGKWLNF